MEESKFAISNNMVGFHVNDSLRKNDGRCAAKPGEVPAGSEECLPLGTPVRDEIEAIIRSIGTRYADESKTVQDHQAGLK